jgi:hypothetical protein
MTDLLRLVDHPLVSPLGWSLLHFVWQGALIGLIAFAVLRVVRPVHASARYLVGVVALGALLLTPIVTFVTLVDRSARAVIYTAQTSVGEFGVGADAVAKGGGFAGPARSAGRNTSAVSGGLVTGLIIADVAASPEAARLLMPVGSASRDRGSDVSRAPAWLPAVTVTWMLGVLCLSIRLLGGWLLTRRLPRRAVHAVSPHIEAAARDVARRLALHRTVAILESAAVTVPTLVGWVRPVVLLPAAALSGLSAMQLEAILAHELAHVRRHDYLVNLLQSAVETLLFYHPAVWWVSSEVRAERENCCDDLAVAVCGDRLVYVSALAELTSIERRAFALAATDGSLLSRVRRILGRPGDTRRELPPSWSILVLVGLLAGGAGTYEMTTAAAGSAGESDDDRTATELVRATPSPDAVARDRDGWTVDLATPHSQAAEASQARADEDRARAEEARARDQEAEARAREQERRAAEAAAKAREDEARLREELDRQLERRARLNEEIQRLMEARRRLVEDQVRLTEEQARARQEVIRDARSWGPLPPVPSSPPAPSAPSAPSARPAPPAPPSLSGALLGPLPQPPATPASPPAPPAPPSSESRSQGNFQWSDGGERISLKWTGAFRLSDDESDIAYVEPGAVVTMTDGTVVTHRIELRGLEGGGIERSYYRNGAKREFDADARAFFAKALARLVRSGMFARERVARFLKQGGVDAVLAEISRLGESSYVKRVYFGELLKQAELTASVLDHVLAQVAKEVTSDYERSTLLTQVAKHPNVTDGQRAVIARAAKSINSDYEQRRALAAVLAAGEVTPAVAAGVLDAVAGIASDYERAVVLGDLARKGGVTAPTIAEFSRAVAAMKSSHEMSRVLTGLLAMPDLSAELTRELLNMTRRMPSDHERANMLVAIARRVAIAGDLRTRYVEVAESIGSQHEQNRALAGLIRNAK